MARIWENNSGQEIHYAPKIKFKGKINFDNGTYEISEYTKSKKMFGLPFIMEIWQNHPSESNSKCLVRLFHYDYTGHSSESTSAKTWSFDYHNSSYSDSYVTAFFRGAFDTPPSGSQFYIVTFCGAHYSRPSSNKLKCDNLLHNDIYPWYSDWIDENGNDNMGKWHGDAVAAQYYADMREHGYWIFTERIQVTEYIPGRTYLDVSSSGTTIIATPSYDSKNIIYADERLTMPGKIAVHLCQESESNVLQTVYVDMSQISTSCQFKYLHRGTEYIVVAEAFESKDGSANKISYTQKISTYECTCWRISHTDTSITYGFWVNNDFVGNVYFWTFFDPVNFNPNNIALAKEVAVGEGGLGSVTIDGFDTNTRVYFNVAPKGVVNADGILDAIASIDDRTWNPTDFSGMNVLMTGTTITMTPSFSVGDSGNVDWSGTLNNVTKTGTGNQSVRFESLTNGKTYNAVFKGLYSKSTFSGATGSDTRYTIRTYSVQLKEYTRETNSFSASIYQIPGAAGSQSSELVESKYYRYDSYCVKRVSGVDSTQTFGRVSINGEYVVVDGLEPSTNYRVYVWLDGCLDQNRNHDTAAFIDFTTKSIVSTNNFSARVTGKTITVVPGISGWGASESLTYTTTLKRNGSTLSTKTTTCTSGNLVTTTFTGLKNGTTYTLSFSAHDNNNNDIPLDDIVVTTYGIQFTNSGRPYTRRLKDVAIRYTDGERDEGISQDKSKGALVRWWIVDKNDNIVDGKVIVNCIKTNPGIYSTNSKLVPITSYTMYAEIAGVEYEGINDTQISYEFYTEDPPRGFAVTTSATGETISVTPTWVDSVNDDNEVTVSIILSLDNKTVSSKTTKKKDEPVWFTNLKQGKTYDIVYTAVDNEGNSTSDYLDYVQGGSTTETTYELLVNDIEYYTRSMKWTVSANRPLPEGSVIEYYIDQGNNDIKVNWADDTIKLNTPKSCITLYDKTRTTLKVRIKDMKNRADVLDTVKTVQFLTKELKLNITGVSYHADGIDLKVQAFADNEEYDYDPISYEQVSFVDDLCFCNPVIRDSGVTGDNHGKYSLDKKRYYTGLTGDVKYSFTIGVTDGMNSSDDNNVKKTAVYTTLLELIRIYHNGEFQNALPYIYHNGKWRRATAYIYTSKVDGRYRWVRTDPEKESSE